MRFILKLSYLSSKQLYWCFYNEHECDLTISEGIHVFIMVQKPPTERLDLSSKQRINVKVTDMPQQHIPTLVLDTEIKG